MINKRYDFESFYICIVYVSWLVLEFQIGFQEKASVCENIEKHGIKN